MSGYGIKTHLLDKSEVSRLVGLGAELGPSWLKLQRPLTRREMLEVWAIVLALRERTGDPENHIEFAVGDWLIAAEKFFGSVEEIVREDGTPRPRIMISYKHQDDKRNDWVRKLCADLRSRFGDQR